MRRFMEIKIRQIRITFSPFFLQMRNLVLSAFPRKMQLPDPFTPDLKVELLPEVSQHPRISPPMNKLIPEHIRKEVDVCLSRNEDNMDATVAFLKEQVMQTESMTGSFYNVSLVNALVFYIGLKGIESESTQSQTISPRPGSNSASIKLWALLLKELDPGKSIFILCFYSMYLFSLSRILRLTWDIYMYCRGTPFGHQCSCKPLEVSKRPYSILFECYLDSL